MTDSNKDRIRRLEAAGYREDIIVLHMSLTHHKVRQALRKPEVKLTKSAREEIYYDTAFDHTQKALAKLYRTTDQEVYKAKYVSPPKTIKPTLEKLEHLYAQHQDFAAVASRSGASLAYVKRELAHYRVKKLPRAQHTAEVSTLLDSNLTYQQIAAQVGCSESTVCNIAKDVGKPRQTQRQIENWPEILKHAETHTVSETSREFGVTRANIYYQQKVTA
tara:strand:- start:9007 stop:9663 length:657 start_codon:yes stop_codon:yes gene_type:complete